MDAEVIVAKYPNMQEEPVTFQKNQRRKRMNILRRYQRLADQISISSPVYSSYSVRICDR